VTQTQRIVFDRQSIVQCDAENCSTNMHVVYVFFIFRDIKLENILLDEDGHCKLADFGLTALGVFRGMTMLACTGTECYCAPEVIFTLYFQYDYFIIFFFFCVCVLLLCIKVIVMLCECLSFIMLLFLLNTLTSTFI
jgi:serine/threonine protein kinase